MKRWIHANTDYDRLKYVKNGEIEYLPTWYLDKSDEEIERVKEILINAPEGQYIPFHEVRIPNEVKLRRDLKEGGFIPPEIDEIIDRMANGSTIDNAIQRQLDLRGSTDIIASSEWAADWSARLDKDKGLHYYVLSWPTGIARVLPNDETGSRYHAEIKFTDGNNRNSVAFEDKYECMDWAEKIMSPKSKVNSSVKASKGINGLDGFVSWNGYNYGRLRGKGAQPDRYFKSKTVRFDDSMGGTEEVSEDEYFEVADKYAEVMNSDNSGCTKARVTASEEFEPSYKFVIYELDDDGEELDSISAFSSEEEAIDEAKRLIKDGQIAQAHVVLVPNEDPDDDPDIAEWYEYNCKYEPYVAVWSSI